VSRGLVDHRSRRRSLRGSRTRRRLGARLSARLLLAELLAPAALARVVASVPAVLLPEVRRGRSSLSDRGLPGPSAVKPAALLRHSRGEERPRDDVGRLRVGVEVLDLERLGDGALFVDISSPRAPGFPALVVELAGASAGFAHDFQAGFAVAFGDGCAGAEVVAVVEAAACGSEVVDAGAAVALPEPLEGFLRWWGDR
jgi:hypothetical protein